MTKQELREQFPELYLEILNDGSFAGSQGTYFASLEHFDNEYATMEEVVKDMQQAAFYEEQEREEREYAELEAQSIMEGEMESPMYDLHCIKCGTPAMLSESQCSNCGAAFIID